METEEQQRVEIKWLLETLCHLQDWLNEEDRTLKQSELDRLVKRYKELQSSNRALISKTNKIEMQYKLEQELDQVELSYHYFYYIFCNILLFDLDLRKRLIFPT